MTPSGHSVTRLRWTRDRTTPARVWRSEYGMYEIVRDPAGRREGEPGGFYLWAGGDELGIFETLQAAKDAAGKCAS